MVHMQKLMVSRAKSGYYPDSLADAKDWEPVRPSLHKHNGRIVYEHLVVLPVVCVQHSLPVQRTQSTDVALVVVAVLDRLRFLDLYGSDGPLVAWHAVCTALLCCSRK